MAKTPHNNNKSPKVTKKYAVKKTWWGDVKSLMGWKGAQFTPAEIDALSERLLEWGHEKDSLSFQQFYENHGIPRQSLEAIRAKNPQVEEAYQFVKEMIGWRRMKLMMYKKSQVNFQPLMVIQRVYDPDFQKCWEEDKAKEAESSHTVAVIKEFCEHSTKE